MVAFVLYVQNRVDLMEKILVLNNPTTAENKKCPTEDGTQSKQVLPSQHKVQVTWTREL